MNVSEARSRVQVQPDVEHIYGSVASDVCPSTVLQNSLWLERIREVVSRLNEQVAVEGSDKIIQEAIILNKLLMYHSLEFLNRCRRKMRALVYLQFGIPGDVSTYGHPWRYSMGKTQTR